jgi:hypothetical protein
MGVDSCRDQTSSKTPKVEITTPFLDRIIVARKQRKTPKTEVEKYLGIEFEGEDEVVENAIKLIQAIAKKKGLYVDAVPSDKVLAASFALEDRYAHAWILLYSGITIDAFISLKREQPMLRIEIHSIRWYKQGIKL